MVKIKRLMNLGLIIILMFSGINTVFPFFIKILDQEEKTIEKIGTPGPVTNEEPENIDTRAITDNVHAFSDDGKVKTSPRSTPPFSPTIVNDISNPRFITYDEDVLSDTDLELQLHFDEGTDTSTSDSSTQNRSVTMEDSWEGDEWSSASYTTAASYCLYFESPENVYAVMSGQDINDTAWSFGIWGKINRTGTNGNNSLWSMFDSTESKNSIALYYNNASNRFYILIEGTSADGQWYADSPVDVSEWQFYVVTWTGNTSEVPKFYVNGTMLSLTEDNTFGGDPYDADRFIVGETASDSGYGYLDDAYIYSSVLSNETIETLYQTMPEQRVKMAIMPSYINESSPYLYSPDNSTLYYGNDMSTTQSVSINFTVGYNGSVGISHVNLTESWFGDTPEYNLSGATYSSTNVILNPSFEDGVTGDADNWDGTNARAADQAHSGTYHMALTGPGQYTEQDIIDIPVAMVHNFTFWLWSGWDHSHVAIIYYTDGSNTTKSWQVPSGMAIWRLYNISEYLVDGKVIDKIRLRPDTTLANIRFDDVYLYTLPQTEAQLTFTIENTDIQVGNMIVNVWSDDLLSDNTTVYIYRDTFGPSITFDTAFESSNYLYYNNTSGWFSDNMGGTPVDFSINGTTSDIGGSGVGMVNVTSIFGETPPSNSENNTHWQFDFPIDSGYSTYFRNQEITSPDFSSGTGWSLWHASRNVFSGSGAAQTYHSSSYSVYLEPDYGDGNGGGWVRQSLSDIPVDSVSYFYVWVRDNFADRYQFRVNVTYNDTTEDSFEYTTIGDDNYNQYFVTGMDAGKFISQIKVQSMNPSTSSLLFIDDVYMYTNWDDNDTTIVQAWDNVGNAWNEFNGTDQLLMYYDLNDASSGQTIITDSSSYSWDFREIWDEDSGFNDSSYNNKSQNCLSLNESSDSLAIFYLYDGYKGQDIAPLKPENFTIGFWINIARFPSSSQPIVPWGKTNHIRMQINSDSWGNEGEIQVRFWPSGTGTSNYHIPLKQWTFVTLRYNGSHCAFFFNGTKDNEFSPTNFVPSGNDLVEIFHGYYSFIDAEFYIDDFFLYNKALSDLEIEYLYHTMPWGIDTTFTFISDNVGPSSSPEFDPMSAYYETGDIDETYGDTTLNYFYFSNSTDSDVNITFEASVTDSGSGIRGVDYGSFDVDNPAEDQMLPYLGNYTINTADSAGSISVVAYDNVGNSATEIIHCFEDQQAPIMNITGETENSSYLYAEFGNSTQSYYGSAMESLQSFTISGTAINNITGLTNGGFETGSLYPWTTDVATISTDENYVREGTYGVRLNGADYKTGAYVEQEDLWIYTDYIDTFSFVGRDRTTVHFDVVVFYSDGTNTTQTFDTDQGIPGAVRHDVKQYLDTNKIIVRIRIASVYETTDSATTTLDDVELTYRDVGHWIFDNTTFGNDPSMSGTNTSWSFTYQIDSIDNGNITVLFSAQDFVGNIANLAYFFYEDNDIPQIDFQPYSITNEDSDFLYYDNTSHYGYYSDNMGIYGYLFHVGGNASETGSGVFIVTDNTTFGGNPSNSGNDTNWVFVYNITSSDSSGSFNVTYTIIDNVGNFGTTWFYFYEDNTNPASSLQSLTENSPYLHWNGTTLFIGNGMGSNPVYFTVTITSSDQGSNPSEIHTVQFLTTTWGSNNPLNDTSSPYSRQLSIINSQGSTTLEIKTIDNVGNLVITSIPVVDEEDDGETLTIEVTAITENSSYLHALDVNNFYYGDMMSTLQTVWFNCTATYTGFSGIDNVTVTTTWWSDHPYDKISPYDLEFNISSFDTDTGTLTVIVWTKFGWNDTDTVDIHKDSTEPAIAFSSAVTSESSSYLYYDGSSQHSYYSYNMGTTLSDFYVGGTSSDIGSGLYSITDNTTFGNNPYNSGTNESWVFLYKIDQNDGSYGTFTIIFAATDLVGNTATDIFEFRMDIKAPEMMNHVPNRTHEESAYLYYDNSSNQGRYGDAMLTTQDFTVGGNANDSGSGLYSVIDNTDFGNDPSRTGTLTEWNFTYSINPADSSYFSFWVTYTATDNCGNTNTTEFLFIFDTSNPIILFVAAYTYETSIYLYYDNISTYGYYSDNMGSTLVNFRIGGTASEGENPLVSISHNATNFGNNPSNSANFTFWVFNFQIDENDDVQGNFVVEINATDSMGNNGTTYFTFFLDNDKPVVNHDPTATFESSIYVYYDGSSSFGYYSDKMGASAAYFTVGGNASDPGCGLLVVFDDTTFGGDPINTGTLSEWSFIYEIDQDNYTYGTIVIKFNVADNCDNNNEVTFQFRLDNDDPLISFSSGSTNEFSDYLYYDNSSQYGYYSDNMGATIADFTVGGMVSDSGSGMYSVIDSTDFGDNPLNGGTATTWNLTYHIDENDYSYGTFIVIFTATDNCGNINTDDFQFRLDTTAPTGYSLNLTQDEVTVDDIPRIGYDDDGDVTFTVSGGFDSDSGLNSTPYSYSWNGSSWQAWTSDTSYNNASARDGYYVLYLRLIDRCGNIGDYVTETVVVDSPPVISLIGPENDTVLFNTSVIDITASDSTLELVWYHWDSEASKIITSPWNVVVPVAEGYHWLYFYCNDSIGHFTSRSYRWYINSPPVIILNDTLNNSELMSNEALMFNITDSTLVEVTFSWNQADSTIITSPYTISLPREKGWHELSVDARDSFDWVNVQYYRFYVFDVNDLLSIDSNQDNPRSVYETDYFNLSFTVINPNNIPIMLDIYIFGVDDDVLEGNNSVLTLGPGEQKVISFYIKPRHASLHELTVKLFHKGQLFIEYAYSYEVYPLLLHPLILFLITISLLIVGIVGSIIYLTITRERKKTVRGLKTVVGTEKIVPPRRYRKISKMEKRLRKGEKQVSKDKKLPATPPPPLETEII
ncbi:MAG: LamG-like jellyroll fold domain-containing protein [Candidatus Hodarchaeales archaeon]